MLNGVLSWKLPGGGLAGPAGVATDPNRAGAYKRVLGTADTQL